MNVHTIMQLGRETLVTTALLVSPLLLVAVVVGLAITVLQTITSIREQTLTFVPKLAAVLFTTVVLMPWLIGTLVKFTASLLTNLDRFMS